MPAVNARTGSPTKFLVTTLVLGAVTVSLAAARPVTRTPAVPVAGGVTFNYTVTSSAADKKVKEASEIHAKVRMQGGNVRMDYTNGGPLGQKGAYILMTNSPSQLAIVSDKDKTVMIMDAAMFGSGMGAMMNNAMMKMTVSNAKFSYKDLGAGESILGYSTRKARVYSGMDVEMKMMGMTQRSSSSDSSDQWIAQSIDVDDDALAAWGRTFRSGMKSTNPEVAAEFAKFEKDFGHKGMALRSITWSTRTDGKGKVASDTIRMEVTDLVKGAIDAAVFKMPAGYEVTNLSEAMKGAQASMDSANKASGADTAKGKKPGATDGIKAGIGGMFKKKPPQ